MKEKEREAAIYTMAFMQQLVIMLPTRNEPVLTIELQVQKGMKIGSSIACKYQVMKRKTVEVLGKLILIELQEFFPYPRYQVHVLSGTSFVNTDSQVVACLFIFFKLMPFNKRKSLILMKSNLLFFLLQLFFLYSV